MQTVVVTGSTRGIGFGLADAFLARGCAVVVSGRTEAGVAAAVAELARRHGPGRVHGAACDVTRADDVAALWAAAVRAGGRVDVWINNAGGCPPTKAYADLSAAEVADVVDVNVRGTMLGAHAALRGMLAQGGGQLFFMEGWGSRGEWSPGMTVYTTTKRAMDHLARALVRETRGTAVRVGTLGPGIVPTDLLVAAWTGGPPAHWRRVRRLFHFVLDAPEPVCAYLADKVLANRRTGVHFRWMHPLRLGVRFFQPRYWRRRPLAGTALEGFGGWGGVPNEEALRPPSPLPPLPRRAWHRRVFVAAGVYNVAWGLWSALDPQWLFRFAGMAPLNQPAIFQCLAMVVGLYGVAYLEVARRPERGWVIAAVGLAGKVLGPAGLAVQILGGAWPAATVVLCVTNDFVWWAPFGLYLWDAWPHFRRDLVGSDAGVNTVGGPGPVVEVQAPP